MATNEQQQRSDQKKPSQPPASEKQKVEEPPIIQQIEQSPIMQKEVGPLRAFFSKFSNDWTMNLQAAALAYNLVVAIFPILLDLFLLFGLTLGKLAPDVQKSF